MENDFKPKEVNQLIIQADLPVANKTFYQANKIYIWVVGFSLILIAVLAFFAFRPAPVAQVKEANVSVEISAPESLPSGNEAVYRFALRNNDTAKLTDLELELIYPEGLSFVESTPNPKNLSGTVFDVPDLLPGQNVTVIVKAKTSGDINAEKKLTAKLHYKYTNFNSSFSKEAFHTLRLTASDIALEIDGPKETNSGQLVAFNIKYKNNAKNPVKNARIKMVYPQGFNYADSQPTASLGGNIWNIGDLQSEAEGQIVLQGTFSASQPGEGKTMAVEFLSLGPNGEYFVQNTAETHTNITSQPLLVSLENLDGEGQTVVKPGASLNFAVKYQNNAETAASAVNIAVTLDSKALDFSSLQAQGAQVVGGTITWNAAGVPALEILNPGEKGALNFYIRVKDPATKDASKNLSVKITSKIKASEYSTFLPGASLELKIASPSEIQTQLTHASGSLPPKVGTQTKYKLSLKLLNSSNDFIQGELTCFLPSVAGTFNLQSVPANERSNVQFDSSTGKLTWKVGSLSAFSGKFSPAKTLEFEVSLNPAISDVNKSPLLARSIRFMAKDSFTDQDVEVKVDDITTASVEGQGGYGEGLVIP